MVSTTSCNNNPKPEKTSRAQQKQRILLTIVLLSSIFIRVLIGFHNHSGQNNNHNNDSKVAYGGDYEAQRHWMELTLHLPLREWYYYDLKYWGLDYPILTAYISYICGYVADMLVSEESMALGASRGYEDNVLKTYMRGTVLVFDVLIYFSCMVVFSRWIVEVMTREDDGAIIDIVSLLSLLYTKNIHIYVLIHKNEYIRLLQILYRIDHGHFQYNTIALGLACWSFYFLSLHNENNYPNNDNSSVSEVSFVTSFVTIASIVFCSSFYIPQILVIGVGISCWTFYFVSLNRHHENTSLSSSTIIASILFCASLNFKQMSLYYAPTIFFYLLGKCYTSTTTTTTNTSVGNRIYFLWKRFVQLGITVITTFIILWYPYFHSILSSSSSNNVLPVLISEIHHVLHRIFPFYRGLFESKVSNIWCVLSIKPIQIQKRIDSKLLPSLALVLTLVLLLPSCLLLFQYSKLSSSSCSSSSNNNDNDSKKKTHNNNINMKNKKEEIEILLWALSATTLSFFLGSYQVHEKSILMTIAPMSLLFLYDDIFVGLFFTTFSTWTLWPLLQVDELCVAYWMCQIIFTCFVWIYHLQKKEEHTHTHNGIIQWMTYKIMIPFAWVCMIVLHIAEVALRNNIPEHLPDLFSVLWSIVGCFFFCWSWLYCTWNVYVLTSRSNRSKRKNDNDFLKSN